MYAILRKDYTCMNLSETFFTPLSFLGSDDAQV